MSFKIDVSALRRYSANLRSADHVMPQAMANALNRVGDMARTQLRRQVAKQMGVPYGAVSSAIATIGASQGRLVYELVGTGKAFTLAKFGPVQRKEGVSAAPWGRRIIFRGTFMVERFGGEVFKHAGPGRKIKKLFGPRLPRELLRDQAPVVFMETAEARFSDRLNHEIGRLMKRN